MRITCPHCQNPVELTSMQAPAEARCAVCGSTFRVESQATVTWSDAIEGKRLGRLELLKVVGTGGFGTVYKARDPQLDRVVAVKVPRAGNLPDGHEFDRFLREARSTAQLRHPAIVPVHDIGRDDGVPYLVSDFIEGVTLADRLTAGRLSFREAAELIAIVSDALDYAHRQGVVHRDVKPSNIMLRLDGTPVVMDFGLAKRTAGEITMTVDGQVLGTPAYMSPEQARGEGHAVDGRSDVYSLGVILYRLLTGDLPFRGNQRMLLHQILHDEPKSPRALNDRIPRDLETICLRAMANEPSRRYVTASDLAADLRRWLAGAPIHARPVGRIERSWRWCRRNAVVVGLLAALFLALSGGLVGVGSQWLRAEGHHRRAEENYREARSQRNLALARQQQAHRSLYNARINLAQVAWNMGQVERVLAILEGLRPDDGRGDLRGFEWYYLRRLCHEAAFSLRGHDGWVTSVAFSPDGNALATGSHDRTVRLWDVATGRQRQALGGHDGWVTSVAFSPDGDLIASGATDGMVLLWDATTGRHRARFAAGAGEINALDFAPDGVLLAAGYADGTTRLWEVATGRERAAIAAHRGRVTCLAFAPDGDLLATGGSDRVVRLWGTTTWTEVATLRGHNDGLASLAFSPGGRTLASVANWDRTARLWDVATGRERATLLAHRGRVLSVAYSPDGRTLATAGGDEKAILWDPDSGRERARTGRHAGVISALAFSPGGRALATAGGDATAKLWETRTGSTWTGDEGSGRRVTERSPMTFRSYAWSVRFTPDGRGLAAGIGPGGIPGDGEVRLWDIASGEVRAIFDDGPSGTYRPVAISPDGRTLAAGCQDGTARLWDIATGRELAELRGHDGPISSIAIAPDGRALATGSSDGTVKLWDVATHAELAMLRGHGRGALYVTFAPDGSLLATASYDRSARLWDVASGEPRAVLRGHTGWVTSAAFSPDGRTLATTGGAFDTTVKLWEVATGRERATLRGHVDAANACTFSPDGRALASGGEDGVVKLWDPLTGHERLTLLYERDGRKGPVLSLAFASDGRALAAVGALVDEIRLWDSAPPRADLAE